VEVDTPRGLEAYGVLVAPTYSRWRSRILTYPNILWLEGDGRTTVKFLGRTAREAEAQAIAFIESHCASRGFTIRAALAPAASRSFVESNLETGEGSGTPEAAPRKNVTIPVRFGAMQPTDPGVTVNVSEGGMFVGTRRLLEPGSPISVDLFVGGSRPGLRGVVVWSRPVARAGQPRGIGIHLHDPPSSYRAYVSSL
jgi:hypothetical protein